MPDEHRYSVTELADLAGVTPRTVRFYLAQGLLPSVGHSGPGSKYDRGHLARLRLIRRLQAEHLPLAEIRRRLGELDDEEIRTLAGNDEPAPPPDSAIDYLRSILGSGSSRRTPAVRDASGAIPPPSRTPALSRRLSEAPRITPAPALSASPAPDAIAERHGEPYAPMSAMTPTVPPAPAAQPIERSQWERIVLAPDVELHIRRPLGRAQNKQVDRLVTIARELLEEDRP